MITTRDLLKQARKQGITIKQISEMTQIKLCTLYSFSNGKRNLSKQKQEKVRSILQFLLSI